MRQSGLVSEIKSNFLPALFFSLMLTLIPNLATFFSNKIDFTCDAVFVVKSQLPSVLLVFIVILAITALFSKIKSIVYAVLVSVCVMFLLEGGPLSIGLPLFNGDVDAYNIVWRGIVDSLLWISAIALAIIFRRRIYANITIAVIALLFVSMAGLVDSYLKTHSMLSATNNMTNEQVLKSTAFNRDNNVIIFLLDAVGTEVTSDVFTQHPELKTKYPGFINFSNNVGMQYNTALAVPAIITGDYFDKGFIADYPKTIYTSPDSLINYFMKNGYDIVFDVALPTLSYSTLVAEDSSAKSSLYSVGFVRAKLDDFTIFKYLPYALKTPYLKKVITFNNISDQKARQSDRYKTISTAPINTARPTFQYHHFAGGHIPFDITPSCEFTTNLRPPSYEAYYDKSYCEFKSISAVLDNMTKNGIYDNSTIIIIGDHSNGFFQSEKLQEMHGSALPTMLIKPKNNKEAFTSVDTPTSTSLLNSFVKKYVSSNQSMSNDDIIKALSQDKREFSDRSDDNSDYSLWIIDKDYNVQQAQVTVKKRLPSKLNPLALNMNYDLRLDNTRNYPDIITANLLQAGGTALRIKDGGTLSFKAPSAKSCFIKMSFLRPIGSNGNLVIEHEGIKNALREGLYDIQIMANPSKNNVVTITFYAQPNSYELASFTIEEMPDFSDMHASSHKMMYNIEVFNKKLNMGDTSHISGWAIDSTAHNTPSSVWIMMGDRYFKCDVYERPDVSEYFKDKGVLNSGIQCMVDSFGLPADKYDASLVLVENNKKAKYVNNIGTVDVFANDVDTSELRNLPKSSHNFNSSIDILPEKMTKDSNIISGWSVDASTGLPPSSVWIVIGDNASPCAQNSRPDVARYFNNNNYYSKSGFKCTIDIDNITQGKHNAELIFMEYDDKTKYTKSLTINIAE